MRTVIHKLGHAALVLGALVWGAAELIALQLSRTRRLVR